MEHRGCQIGGAEANGRRFRWGYICGRSKPRPYADEKSFVGEEVVRAISKFEISDFRAEIEKRKARGRMKKNLKAKGLASEEASYIEVAKNIWEASCVTSCLWRGTLCGNWLGRRLVRRVV
jgi:hypothetical protein